MFTTPLDRLLRHFSIEIDLAAVFTFNDLLNERTTRMLVRPIA